MKNNILAGHICSYITILIWGTTFISTKILLTNFTPIEILFIRFTIGYLVLLLVYPHSLCVCNKKQELHFTLAGLCGVTLYYLSENIALTYTLASNVGVIISISPFFTAIFSCIFLHSKRPSINFFIGFIIALTGICLISFNSESTLTINTLGDLLAIAAAIIWSIYSIITKKISTFGYNTVQTTRRIFFYGLLFMLPALFSFGFDIRLSQFLDIKNTFNILFLGFGASALCFVTWNFAVKILGSVNTSIYIYMVPVITTISSIIILHEKITVPTILGIVLTLTGLFLSEGKISLQNQSLNNKNRVKS